MSWMADFSVSSYGNNNVYVPFLSMWNPRDGQKGAHLNQELRSLVVPHHGGLFGADVGDFGGYLGNRRPRRGCKEKADGLGGGIW